MKKLNIKDVSNSELFFLLTKLIGDIPQMIMTLEKKLEIQ